DATMQPAPQDIQLMSKHRVLSLKPHLRLERRGQDGQSETEQPDHSASLGDSITASTQIRFSVHTGVTLMAKHGRTRAIQDMAPIIGSMCFGLMSWRQKMVSQGMAIASSCEAPRNTFTRM